MGAQQLAGVMTLIHMKTGKPMGNGDGYAFDVLEKQVEEQSSAFFASGQLWDDNVIDPRKTREYLGMSLSVIHNSDFSGSNDYGVFRM